MDSYQKRLLALAIDSLYVPDKSLQPRVLPATIYSEPVTLRGKINAILQKLSLASVDAYITKCQQGQCMMWTGYKSRGYPQIKIKNERFTVIQILALLFLDQPSLTESAHERKLKKSCENKACVNILHYSHVTTKHGQKRQNVRAIYSTQRTLSLV